MKLALFFLLLSSFVHAQSPPWKSPLKMAWSNDGKTFSAATIFQDSSGVPCVIRWKGDTLIAAFQWFRAPQNTPSWDRVAVKFSYDAGLSWTACILFPEARWTEYAYSIFDLDGQLLKAGCTQINAISLDGIPKGICLLKIQAGDAFGVFKFLKY